MLLLQDGVVSGVKRDFQVEAYQNRMFYEVEVSWTFIKRILQRKDYWPGTLATEDGWFDARFRRPGMIVDEIEGILP